jgi:hypothetical protein
MPSGDDDAIVARWGPLLVFGELLLSARLLVELLAGERFLGALFLGELLLREFLAGRSFLE